MAFPHTEDMGWQAGCLQDKGQDRGDPFIRGTRTGKRASLTKMRFQPQGHRQNREHAGARAVVPRHGCCLAPHGKSGLCRYKAHRPAPCQAVEITQTLWVREEEKVSAAQPCPTPPAATPQSNLLSQLSSIRQNLQQHDVSSLSPYGHQGMQ